MTFNLLTLESVRIIQLSCFNFVCGSRQSKHSQDIIGQYVNLNVFLNYQTIYSSTSCPLQNGARFKKKNKKKTIFKDSNSLSIPVKCIGRWKQSKSFLVEKYSLLRLNRCISEILNTNIHVYWKPFPYIHVVTLFWFFRWLKT